VVGGLATAVSTRSQRASADAEVGLRGNGRHGASGLAAVCINGVVEETLRNGKAIVTEILSGRGGCTKVDSRQTAVNISEGQGNTTLMSLDNILKRGLRTAWKTWYDKVIGYWRGWVVKCGTFAKLMRRGH
jgi:hypothetical protein